MTPTPIRLVSLLCFALFCATLSFWAITLTLHKPPPPAAATADDARVSIDEATRLFGGQANAHHDLKLAGVLALQADGAAAIVGFADQPDQSLRAVSVGQRIDSHTRLVEVRLRSIIIERDGVRSEIFLPATTATPTIYMR